MIVVAGSGADLCVRDTIDSPWRFVDNSVPITKVAALRGGQILAVGRQQELYVRASLEAAWEPMERAAGVIAVAAMPG
jgi:hypothetical protein